MNSKSIVKKEFGWNLTSNFSQDQKKVIYEAGNAILAYLDEHTAGRGKAWMIKNVGKVNFFLGDLPQKVVTAANKGKPTSVTFIANGIWLEPTFEKGGNPIQHVIHEVAHVIDNAVGNRHDAVLSIWFGHGPSDALTKYLGGTPKGLRWKNGSSGIRNLSQWVTTDPETQYGYGNHSTADYFAESFAWAIVEPSKIIQPQVEEWIKRFIHNPR